MTSQEFDATQLSSESAPGVIYDQYLEEGSLAYQHCTTCDAAVFPPRVLCPELTCSGSTLEWRTSSGGGTVHSVTWLRPRDRDPYNVVLVDVDEGFRMMSNVVGSDDVTIGTRVHGSIKEVDGQLLPIFEIKDR